MKKIALLLAITMMSVVNSMAQTDDPQNEIGISYGLGVSLIGDGIGHGIGPGGV